MKRRNIKKKNQKAHKRLVNIGFEYKKKQEWNE